MIALTETELLCFYRVGQAFYSSDGVLAQLRSADGGHTWAPDGFVWDPVRDNHPYTYSSPNGVRLADGALLVTARRGDASDPDRLEHNPETGGSAPVDIVLFRSDDQGKTWSPPEALDLPGDGCADAPSQIIELSDGRWFMACELWKAWDDPSPLHLKTFAVFSDDQGKTWHDHVDFPSASDTEKMYSHSRYTRMRDGRICALQWTQAIGGQTDVDLHFTTSDETGKTWSYPAPTGLMGQTSWVADLGDDLLAAVYTCREGMQPGIFVVLSVDGGRTWDADNQVIVWDAVGQEYLGVSHKPSYPASHDNIAFGKPNLARIAENRLICSWWCTQACVTHARFARLRVG